MISTADADDHPLRLLIVCQGDLGGASEKQALGFAEQLCARGHRVLLSLHGDRSTATTEGAGAVAGLELRFHSFRGRSLSRADLAAARAFAPDLVHAFNPRVVTVTAARAYVRATGAPLLVHWEDDEWSIRGGYGRRSPIRRVMRLGRRLLAPLLPAQGVFVTPRSLDWVRRNAVGHDALTPALAERVRERIGRDCAVVLPITPRSDARLAAVPPLPQSVAGHALVGLTGEVHPGSVDDLELALQAVAILQRRGHRVALVHAGKALPRYDLDEIARAARVAPGTAVFLGYRPFAEIPLLLERLDVLVQPGRPTEFNRLRLPSKMQAYLESGTPTIGFGVGFAELLEDRAEVLKLHGFDADELAARIEDVVTDEDLAQRLAAGARAAAERLLDPGANCDALVSHYRERLAARNKAPRALYVIQQREYSGAETAHAPVLRGDPHALVACPPGSPTENWLRGLGVATAPLPYRTIRASAGRVRAALSIAAALRTAIDLRRLIRAHPERRVVVGTSLRPSILASLACLRLRDRHVVWIATDRLPPPPFTAPIRRLARVRCDRLLCHSRFIADDITARGGPPPSRTSVVHPGVRLDSSGDPPRTQSRRAVVVGHISPTKRTDLAIDVAALVAARVPEFELEIIGAAQFREEDFQLEKTLRARVAADGLLSRHVTFTGRVSDVPRRLRDAALLLHCRADEPFGMVLIEAMAAGLPVVAPAAGGPLEIVVDDETGLLYPAGDAAAAADCVVRILSDAALAGRMGAAGRRRAAEHFAEERQVAQTLSTLANVGH